MERQDYISQIIKHLTFLQMLVKNNNSASFTDINNHAESFFTELLNLLFGYQLKNINIEDKNAAAIDLGDESNGIAIQVTSTRTVGKIKKTLKSFVANKLEQKYSKLVILLIGDKPKYKTKTLTEAAVTLELSDAVWGLDTLVSELAALSIDRLKEILELLKKEVPLAPEEKESVEVATFVSLIVTLSDSNQELAGKGFKEEPDPKGKIEHRFSAHSGFLKGLYTKLYVEYGAVLDEVIKATDLGHAKIRRLGLYLMNMSNSVLEKHRGDPKAALDDIHAQYVALINKKGVEYCSEAILFFLVDQLIKCNVFPNPEDLNA